MYPLFVFWSRNDLNAWQKKNFYAIRLGSFPTIILALFFISTILSHASVNSDDILKKQFEAFQRKMSKRRKKDNSVGFTHSLEKKSKVWMRNINIAELVVSWYIRKKYNSENIPKVVKAIICNYFSKGFWKVESNIKVICAYRPFNPIMILYDNMSDNWYLNPVSSKGSRLNIFNELKNYENVLWSEQYLYAFCIRDIKVFPSNNLNNSLLTIPYKVASKVSSVFPVMIKKKEGVEFLLFNCCITNKANYVYSAVRFTFSNKNTYEFVPISMGEGMSSFFVKDLPTIRYLRGDYFTMRAYDNSCIKIYECGDTNQINQKYSINIREGAFVLSPEKMIKLENRTIVIVKLAEFKFLDHYEESTTHTGIKADNIFTLDDHTIAAVNYRKQAFEVYKLSAYNNILTKVEGVNMPRNRKIDFIKVTNGLITIPNKDFYLLKY